MQPRNQINQTQPFPNFRNRREPLRYSGPMWRRRDQISAIYLRSVLILATKRFCFHFLASKKKTARLVRAATKIDTQKSLPFPDYEDNTIFHNFATKLEMRNRNGATGANDIYSRTPFDQQWSCLDFGFYSVRNHVAGLSMENRKIQSRRDSQTSHRGSQKRRHASQKHRRGSHQHLSVTKDRCGSQKNSNSSQKNHRVSQKYVQTSAITF